MATLDWQRIELPGADVALQPHWLAPAEADALLSALLSATSLIQRVAWIGSGRRR